jgi:hypothetical protein
MATGIVKTITPTGDPNIQPTTGTVEADETGEIISFEDPNFPATGLIEGDVCTFDVNMVPARDGTLTPIAINLAKVTVVESPITGPFTGDITANAGQTFLIKSAAGVVTGNININGGKVIVADSAQINGNVSVNDGVFVARKSGGVKGSILINGGGSLKVVNGGVIKGNINITAGARLIIGNDNGGGTINGSLSIQKIRKIDITSTSKING